MKPLKSQAAEALHAQRGGAWAQRGAAQAAEQKSVDRSAGAALARLWCAEKGVNPILFWCPATDFSTFRVWRWIYERFQDEVLARDQETTRA